MNEIDGQRKVLDGSEGNRLYCRRSVKIVCLMTAALSLVCLLLSFPFGSCQWSRYHYIFQAYVWPKHEHGWIMPAGDYSGPWLVWYSDGNQMGEGNYRNGKDHGKWTLFDVNGLKERSAEYRDGKFHGNWVSWHPNGQVKRKGGYRDGLPHGKWVWSNAEGDIVRTEYYLRGKKVSRDVYLGTGGP